MKIAVIGAGISGLSFAKYAKLNGMNVKVYERDSKIGGIAKVKDANSIPYHMIGGHCFNSKHHEVLDFVFQHVLPIDNWNKLNRRASILFDGHEIPYPIEFSMKDIYKFAPEKAIRYVNDYMSACRSPSDNLESWFVNNFGNSLAKDYFIPYNRKIWGREPSSMSPNWVVDKLPLPNSKSFITGLLDSAKDIMPHSSFYYPKSGTQNTFIEALAEELDITLNCPVQNLSCNSHGQFDIGGELFDKVIFTGELNNIEKVVKVDSEEVRNAISNLEYNKVTTVLWETEETGDTWTYIPCEDILFHRLIHIGNFTDKKINVCMSEAVGEVSYDDMVKAGKKLKRLKKPLDYNVSDHAYVVFNNSIDEDKSKIFEYFSNSNVHLLGRFGQWDYFNMDICIHQAIQLFNEIKK